MLTRQYLLQILQTEFEWYRYGSPVAAKSGPEDTAKFRQCSVAPQAPVKIPRLILIIKKLHGLSPRANYTDRATAACRRSDCQLVRIEGAMWSA
jgi:hypothetical protein